MVINMEKQQIIVCGGGIAGAMAAIAAARAGADVTLCERGGCLGGTLTASLIGFILDSYQKTGLTAEFVSRLDAMRKQGYAIITEAEKYLLEEMCLDAGVKLLYYTQVTGCEVMERRIVSLRANTLDGELQFQPGLVIDATGNGSVAALAGCRYDIGDAAGRTQPMSMVALVSGAMESGYVGWGRKEAFGGLLKELGIRTSLGFPSLSEVGGGICCLSVNHEYDRKSYDAAGLTEAVTNARREICSVVETLRSRTKEFAGISLVSTPELIGIRESRRIKCLYTVTLDDVLAGRRQEDAVCTVRYWVDIHALDDKGDRSFTGNELKCLPYDIPFRSQLPTDCDNLILAGRCIGGDFHAHASYRVAGNMAPVGEAAGQMAAYSVRSGVPIKQLKYDKRAFDN